MIRVCVCYLNWFEPFQMEISFEVEKFGRISTNYPLKFYGQVLHTQIHLLAPGAPLLCFMFSCIYKSLEIYFGKISQSKAFLFALSLPRFLSLACSSNCNMNFCVRHTHTQSYAQWLLLWLFCSFIIIFIVQIHIRK